MSPDPNFYSAAQIVIGLIASSVNLATLVMAIVVYRKRRELGFLVLALVLGYNALSSILGVFGISIITMIVRSPVRDRWALLYVPSIVTLVGWTLLARQKKKDA